MNGYICMYNGKKVEVYANTSYEAQKQGAVAFKVSEKNRYKVDVYLCETAQGEQVSHTITS
jgi:ribosomal protein L27